MNCKIPNLVGFRNYYHKWHSHHNQQRTRFAFETWNLILKELTDEFPKLTKGLERLKIFQNRLKLVASFLGRECSPIVAQRAVRGYRILQLHSRLWSSSVSHPISKRALLSFVLLSLCEAKNPLQKTIEDTELTDHVKDLEFIHELTAATVVCPHCKDRLVVDKKVKGVQYCHCPENHSRKIDGYNWIPFIETADLVVWRQPHPTIPGHFVYKVYGYYDDISAQDFLDVQLDMEYRKKWDDTALQLKVVESDKESQSDIIYWEMKWPRMFSNRDYVFARRHQTFGEKDMVVISKAVTHPSHPERKGILRVKEYWSVMHIRAVKGLSQPGVEFGLTYFDNPGVSLPQWLTNWAAMSGIPDFLAKQRKAARVKRYGSNTTPKRIGVSSSHYNDKASTGSGSVLAQPIIINEDSVEVKAATPQDNSNMTSCSSKISSNGRESDDSNNKTSNSNNLNINDVPNASQTVCNPPVQSKEQQKNELLSQFFKEHILDVSG